MNTNKKLTKRKTMKKMANATGWGTNTIWSKPSYNCGHSFTQVINY